MFMKKGKHVKPSEVSSDGIPLTSCSESEWQEARPAYAPDQLNVKKSKNRVTVFATKSPKPKSRSRESVRSLDDATVLSGESVESGTSNKKRNGNTSNSSAYLTAHSIGQNAASIQPNDKNVASTKANESKNVSGVESKSLASKPVESAYQPLSDVNTHDTMSAATIVSDNAAVSPIQPPRKTPPLDRVVESTTGQSPLIGSEKRGKSGKKRRIRRGKRVNGEELIRMKAPETEEELQSSEMLETAQSVISTIADIVDKFNGRFAIKSVESTVTEHVEGMSLMDEEKENYFYVAFPTDHHKDQRGGVIYGIHPTQCPMDDNTIDGSISEHEKHFSPNQKS
ncbi:hypothetical protein M3Y94_01206100 [Aphelenchoides besseyi]|nr:hypothetical protein M3Y94_01206100 [Aphelenchoides besseyi]KAI6228484.1 hypothetical protein M3Y95_00627200 [Aphelenchoides besseyi]